MNVGEVQFENYINVHTNQPERLPIPYGKLFV